MSPADADRWDAKHSASQAQLIPLPPIAFSDHEYWLESLTCKAPSRALDVACGCGECATWLAERGFHVLGLDISTVALEAGAKLASTIGVGDRLVLQQVDLDAGMHVEGPFELVICQRFRDTSLYSVMQALVAPGGLLAVTVLSEVGWEGPPSRFRACPGELQKCFFTEGFHVVFCSEEAGEATAVLRRAGGPAPTPGARPAPLVYLFGLPGAGKNYCGELLAAKLGYVFMDGDLWLPEDLSARLRRGEGFTELQREKYVHIIAQRIGEARDSEFATMGAQARPIVVGQATFKRRHRDVIRSAHPHLVFLWIRTDDATRLERLGAGQNRVDVQLGRKMSLDFEPPAACADEAVLVVENSRWTDFDGLFFQLRAAVQGPGCVTGIGSPAARM